jgi:hypothetical protein
VVPRNGLNLFLKGKAGHHTVKYSLWQRDLSIVNISLEFLNKATLNPPKKHVKGKKPIELHILIIKDVSK